MNKKVYWIFASVIFIFLLTGCGSQSPKSGHWVATTPGGAEIGSFRINESGNIVDFEFVFSFGGGECTLNKDAIMVENNHFSLVEYEIALADLTVEGEFDTETSLTGTYLGKLCSSINDDGTINMNMNVLLTEKEWVAKWSE